MSPILKCLTHPAFVSLGKYRDFEGGSEGWIVTYIRDTRGNWCVWGKTQEEACQEALIVIEKFFHI